MAGSRGGWLVEDPAVAGTRSFRHAALWYEAADDLLAATLDFVRDGVAAGEAVLIASAGPHLQRLRIQLGAAGEHVTWTGMSAASINPRRITAAIRGFAHEHQGRPIRCVQEPAWQASAPDQLCEAIRSESLLSLALDGIPATMLCVYDQQLAGTALAAAQSSHPLVVQGGQWRPSGSFNPSFTVPKECDQPLSSPPPGAAMLTYQREQARVRQFTAQRARAAGLPPDRVTDLVIAVGELAANTLAHTSGPGTLWIWAEDGEIRAQVHDSGEITDQLAGSFLPDPGAVGGGRGLWVVHQLCDLVEIRTGPDGTTVRLRMNRGSEPPVRPRRAAAGHGRQAPRRLRPC